MLWITAAAVFQKKAKEVLDTCDMGAVDHVAPIPFYLHQTGLCQNGKMRGHGVLPCIARFSDVTRGQPA